MYEHIHACLSRQHKAMELLFSLLQEEFELLLARDTDAIVHLEFSIHELLRQMVTEKNAVIGLLAGTRVRDYAAALPEGQGMALLKILHGLDELEQRCARRASQNTELSLGLLDQSRDLLHTVHARITPKAGDTYGKRGAMARIRRPEAALLSGRL